MSIELVEYKDCLQPFLIHHSNIKGKLVRLADSVDTILGRHEYPDVVSHLLAELLIVATMLSTNLKGRGLLTIQLKGEGPVRFIVVDSTAQGVLRGYADIEEESREALEAMKPGEVLLPQLLGKGYICITLHQGREPYQGIVELSGDTIAETLETYFTNSEQSKVHLRLHVGQNQPESGEAEWRAGGILLQRVPEEGGINANQSYEDAEELWQRACLFTDTITDEEMLDQYLPVNQLLYRLFNEDGVWVYDADKVKAGCRCSRKKVANMLISFPREEMEDMIIDGKLSVTCQFCNTRRAFKVEELEVLYAEAASASDR